MPFTPADLRARTLMPREDVDELNAREPGWLAARCAYREGQMNARLKKRYAVPFADPMPEPAAGWLTDILTWDAYKKRGGNPTGAMDEDYRLAAETAQKDIAEAADSETGLYDLPLRADAPEASGVSKGGPFAYSEASPYEWTDRQREAVRCGR